MKKLLIIAVLTMGLGLLANAGSPSVKIYKQSGKPLSSIVVNVKTGSMTKIYWLGVTYKLNGGQEHDFKAVRIWRKGKKSYNIGMILGSTASGKITWIAKLWKKKIKKSKCQRSGCRWCMLNGYHLEDSVATDSVTGDL